MDLSEFKNKNWSSCFVDSEVPEVCKTEFCLLGVDEAGRGPVLGPMVYGVSYCPISWNDELKNKGVADSKTLTEEQREKLFSIIHENKENVGWSLDVISPHYISNCMYKRPKVSLNEVSHNSAIGLIKRVMAAGVKLQQVFVDTVGPPEKYQAKLQEIFPTLEITVSKKADSIFPIVSAASICAKVARDRALSEWLFPENIDEKKWGSGYPGDSVTKNFLFNTMDPVFGFPGIVRFSWSTAEKILESKGVPVTWAEEDDEEDSKKENMPSVLDFFTASKRKRSDDAPAVEHKRHWYFSDRCLTRVNSL